MQITGNDAFVRALAQAGHAVMAKIVNPRGNNPLRKPRGGRGIGDGPALDNHPLNNLAALCGG